MPTLRPVADSSVDAIVETAILRASEIGAVITNPLCLASCGLNAITRVCPRCVCVKCGGNVAFPTSVNSPIAGAAEAWFADAAPNSQAQSKCILFANNTLTWSTMYIMTAFGYCATCSSADIAAPQVLAQSFRRRLLRQSAFDWERQSLRAVRRSKDWPDPTPLRQLISTTDVNREPAAPYLKEAPVMIQAGSVWR